MIYFNMCFEHNSGRTHSIAPTLSLCYIAVYRSTGTKTHIWLDDLYSIRLLQILDNLGSFKHSYICVGILHRQAFVRTVKSQLSNKAVVHAVFLTSTVVAACIMYRLIQGPPHSLRIIPFMQHAVKDQPLSTQEWIMTHKYLPPMHIL